MFTPELMCLEFWGSRDVEVEAGSTVLAAAAFVVGRALLPVAVTGNKGPKTASLPVLPAISNCDPFS